MKKTGILLLLAILLLSTAVYAQDFSATILAHTESIKTNETAKYTLIISHPLGVPQTFEIYSTDILWDVRTKDSLIIPPQQDFETELYLRPLNLNPGIYSVPLHIKLTGTDQIIKQNIPLEVTSKLPPIAAYLPAVRGTAIMSRKVDPKDPVRVYVTLENQNKKLLKKVQVKLRSNVINKDYDVQLKPQEKKKLTFEILIDPYTSPQKDVLRITAVVEEGNDVYQFDLEPVQYTIIDYQEVIEEIIEKKETFKTIRTITLINEGNIPIKEKYTQPTSLLESTFTTTTPKSRRIGNQRIWDINIPKAGALKIQMAINYRPLVFLITAVIILIIAYFIFRSPLTMAKKAAVIGSREGGISELKVLITLKNRSKKRIKQVKIMDLVPRLANYKPDQEIGTVEPDKVIQNQTQGSLLKWHIDSIDPGEERLISYKIRSKLSILGGVTLPVAVAKFETEKGKPRHSNSNKAKIGFLG